MALQYTKDSLHFMYPEGWEISEEQTAQWPREVAVSAPQGGFWSVLQYSTPISLNEVADAILDAMRTDYESFEVHLLEDDEPDAAENENTEDDDQSIGYELYFYFKNRLLRAHCRCFKRNQYTFAVICQSEDRYFDALEPVFQAMTISLDQPATN